MDQNLMLPGYVRQSPRKDQDHTVTEPRTFGSLRGVWEGGAYVYSLTPSGQKCKYKI